MRRRRQGIRRSTSYRSGRRIEERALLRVRALDHRGVGLEVPERVGPVAELAFDVAVFDASPKDVEWRVQKPEFDGRANLASAFAQDVAFRACPSAPLDDDGRAECD